MYIIMLPGAKLVINLLPPQEVRELRAARMNTMLRKYFVTSLFALVTVAAIFGTALYLNHQQLQDFKAERQKSQQELAELNNVKQKVKAYNDSLQTAKTAFASEIRMTTLVKKMSGLLPPGAILSGIGFNLESVSEPLTISAEVDTFKKAGVLKRNFAQSEFFSDVILQQVADASDAEGAANSPYPYTAQLEVTLSSDIIGSSPASKTTTEAGS